MPTKLSALSILILLWLIIWSHRSHTPKSHVSWKSLGTCGFDTNHQQFQFQGVHILVLSHNLTLSINMITLLIFTKTLVAEICQHSAYNAELAAITNTPRLRCDANFLSDQ